MREAIVFRILIVENDVRASSAHCAFLESQGYETISAADSREALAAFEERRVDLMLCDIMAEGLDGVMLVDAVRRRDHNLPIMMLTAHDDLQSKQRAFAAGCDDYMVKPVDLNELALRISALLRRAKLTSKRQITIGNALLDCDTFTVVEGPRVIPLPPREFMVLFKLCSSPGRIFTRRDIMDDVWSAGTESGERTVDVHIKRLRKRLKDSESIGIETVVGVGYRAVVL